MNINNRILELRKNALKLSQENFAKKLGITKSSISKIENCENNVSDRMVLSICREFNVNEEWLRTGNGEMFNTSSNINFEEYTKQKGMTDIEKDIVMNYLNLDIETRSKIIEMLKKTFSKYIENNNVSEKEAEKINFQLDVVRHKITKEEKSEIDKEVEAYRQ